MKVIAFFNLKNGINIKEFNDWVLKKQTKFFEKTQPKMKNFKVFKLVDSDKYRNLPHIVQIFDWNGTQDDWRKILKDFWLPENTEDHKVKKEWMKFCVDDSTQILYAEDI